MISQRFTALWRMWAVLALFVLAHSLPLLGGKQPGRPQVQEVAPGVVSLDVYAQGTTENLLMTSRDGETLELSHQRSTDGGQSWGRSPRHRHR